MAQHITGIDARPGGARARRGTGPRVARAGLALAMTAIALPLPAHGTIPEDADVAGRAWGDINANGIRDGSEDGIAGVVVTLFGQAGSAGALTQVAQTTTDGDGDYGFIDLGAGDYAVQFRLPDELAFTIRDAGDDDTVDSDVDRSTGRTDPVRLAGSPSLSQDAGLLSIPDLILIGGRVWEDRDDDGIQDDIGAEPSMPGVTVNLMLEKRAAARERRRGAGGRPRDRAGEPMLEVVDSQTADGLGLYEFHVLPSRGRYVVEVVPPPDSHETVLRDQGSDAQDSDVDPVSRRSEPLGARVPEQVHFVDIGLAPLADIADRAWDDADRDGFQDAGEPGLQNVFVFLYRLDPRGNVFVFDDLRITDGQGLYRFPRNRPGTYFLRFLPPSGYSFTRWRAGIPVDAPVRVDTGASGAIDSDAMQDTGATPDILLPADVRPGALVSDIWDAGFVIDPAVADFFDTVAKRSTLCGTDQQVDDQEVTVLAVRAVRLLDGSRWFLAWMGEGLRADYSFAVLLSVRTPRGVLQFIWEVHGKRLRIGQIDPETGKVVREVDGDLDVFNVRGLGIVGFRIPAGQIPDDADLAAIQSFHTPRKGEEKRCNDSGTFPVPHPPADG